MGLALCVPNADARLIDRGADSLGNHLVYDTELNVTWYQPNNIGMNWGDAHVYAANLSVTYRGRVFDDWRLPRARSILTGKLEPVCYIGWDGHTPQQQADCLGELAHLFLELGGKSNAVDFSLAINPRAYGNDNPFNTWPACAPGTFCLDAGYYWMEEGDDYDLCGKAGYLIFWNTDYWGPAGARGGICQWQTNYKFAWALRDGDVISAAPMDLKFCDAPNGFNCRAKGKLTATVFGTADLNVASVDLASLRLCLASDPTKCTNSGPSSWSIADRGDPQVDLGAASCTVVAGVEQRYRTPDGISDLDVAFDIQEIATLIGCTTLSKGSASPSLIIRGKLGDGLPFESRVANNIGIDQLLIQGK